jgi:hypothetical protein
MHDELHELDFNLDQFQQLRDPSPVVPGSRYYRVQILQP